MTDLNGMVLEEGSPMNVFYLNQLKYVDWDLLVCKFAGSNCMDHPNFQ